MKNFNFFVHLPTIAFVHRDLYANKQATITQFVDKLRYLFFSSILTWLGYALEHRPQTTCLSSNSV